MKDLYITKCILTLIKFFSKFQCGFRKGFNAQHCLITMIEKWRRSIDGGGQAGALLTDLFKAFDCIDHELLIAKHYASRFDKNSFYFINSYFKGRKQRTKITSSYSAFAESLFGVHQGSILGPLLFNIYICDLFIENSDIDTANYADNNTPYVCSSDLDSVIFKLQKNTERIFKWFYNNNLISNTEKSHLILSTKKNLEIQVSSCSIKNEDRVKLLGIHLNNDLNFDYHVNKLCKKASKKLHALARIAKYMDINKRRMLMKAFVSSQFSYCLLIWMFHIERWNIGLTASTRELLN